ncbi:hypothetical protein ACFLSH_00025 [Bacteroidota bacterium]
MHRKFFISFLLLALINFLVGCYSFESVTVPEYKQVEGKKDKTDEIYIKTKDSEEYRFTKSNSYIENDTLYVNGISLLSFAGLPYEGNFSLGEIKSIQLENFGQKYISLMTVSQYQQIETESGKPDKIYLTKTNSSKYSFMKNDYYIENDTLYGKGKLIIEKDQQFNRNIALSNIESMEVESINWLTTSLLVLGIGVLAITAFYAIALQGMDID